jgi:hypothetical protein
MKTPQERADKLNEFNQHLAKGGMLLFQGVPEVSRTPCWLSDLSHWRMVPLPRTEKIYVAYRWDTCELFVKELVSADAIPNINHGWKIATIEVTEGES